VTTVLTPASPLTAADRCDRCGAQAYLRVVLLSGGELLFPDAAERPTARAFGFYR